ncbi:MAG TPA: hypothetical protein VKB51_02735 [bacterium]|nr:hypothetical protein [bacterium]
MLAFNLSVFFRNLRGEEVAFSARTGQTELHFVGGVVALQEHTDLTQHLAVTLGSGDLLLRIAFEEPEDEEDDPEGANVVVRLLRESGERELLLVQTTFRFGDVSLKPASDLAAHPGEEPPPDDGDQPA